MYAVTGGAWWAGKGKSPLSLTEEEKEKPLKLQIPSFKNTCYDVIGMGRRELYLFKCSQEEKAGFLVIRVLLKRAEWQRRG